VPAASSEFFRDNSHADIAAALQARCFENAWNAVSFRTTLSLPTSILEILSVENDPAAFALYQLVDVEAEILTLGVLPDFRKQGYGKLLLREAIAYFRNAGVTALFLEVGENNISARRLYDAMGFETTGKRPNYYRHKNGPEDAILMKSAIK